MIFSFLFIELEVLLSRLTSSWLSGTVFACMMDAYCWIKLAQESVIPTLAQNNRGVYWHKTISCRKPVKHFALHDPFMMHQVGQVFISSYYSTSQNRPAVVSSRGKYFCLVTQIERKKNATSCELDWVKILFFVHFLSFYSQLFFIQIWVSAWHGEFPFAENVNIGIHYNYCMFLKTF